MLDVKLVLVMPGGRQRKFAVKKEKLIIGRGTDCSLQIPAATVSRHHCELSLSDEQLAVRDLNSSNGTYVNKERIADLTPLEAGDTLTVGPVAFTVVINGAPATISTRKPAKPKPKPQAAEDSGSIDLDELDAVDDLEEVTELQEQKNDDPVAALSALTRPKKMNLPSPKPSARDDG